MADEDKILYQNYYTWYFTQDTETKRQNSELGWWGIPTAKESEIPKVPHRDYVDTFFQLSRRSARTIRARAKTSKWWMLKK